MENYEVLSIAGEGSYGIVIKCKHKLSKKNVAIKKIIDSRNDNYMKKMILREVRILKKLRHENLVQLLEVFKKKRRFYLVFEYLEKTVLDHLENNPKGLGERQTLEYTYQLIRAVEFCHRKNVIHRDIKPENLLISSLGILKLCDFGCARILSNSPDGTYTQYVATRWYRAPELLVRDETYGRPVDIWAVGCVFVEIITGEPLFPGQSDVDQLYMIMKHLGKLCPRHLQILRYSDFSRESDGIVDKLNKDSTNAMNIFHALHNLFPSWSIETINFASSCLNLDPQKRRTAVQLLKNEYFEEKNINEVWFASLLQRSQEATKKSLSKSELNAEHFNQHPISCNLSNDEVKRGMNKSTNRKTKSSKINCLSPSIKH